MQDLNDNIPELKIEFMADGMGDGLILMEQDSCGNVDRVAIHPVHLRYMAEKMGLIETTNPTAQKCRATLQALAEMKNPRPVAFFKQANINNGGNQQVNNGVPTGDTQTPTPARENESEQTKLLQGMTDGSTYMDAGTTSAAGRGDKTLEPVGAVNRAKKRTR